jgi:folylpolyglutamate synthase/dihydropteroate synthase
MRDKDRRAMLRRLLPCASRVVLTAPPTPRATDPEAISAEVLAIDPGADVLVARDPEAALEAAWSAGPSITVAGSIFLLGAVLPLLESRGSAW